MKTKKLHPAWIVLFGVCLFMGLARGGINNTGGLFMVPVMADTGCAGIAAMPGYGFIYDAAGSYIPVLWMIAGMFLLCEFCIAAAFMGKKRLLRRGLWES